MAQQAHILLIGSLKDASSSISAHALKQDIKTLQADDLDKALATLSANSIDMVFIDSTLELPAYFTKLNEAHITVPTVAVGAAQPVQTAVKAIRLGAIEYVSTPVDTAILDSLFEKIKPVTSTDGPIHGDPRTQELLEQVNQFAPSNATILLRGESGTGKEVFSKFIHAQSKRHNKPFVSINCAAIPENLLESELFGHEKGAFSGALNKRIGKFEQAHGGTLLLDEISEMDALLQAKLLRAIQERVIDPVGSSKPVDVDIRLIATTNRDLEEEVAKGTFREDLYFRLNVVMIDIPALRERTGDIKPLSRHFARIFGEQNGIKSPEISDEAIQKLNDCYWKGNVRELENTVHRAILMMGGETTMQPEHIVISPMSQNMASNLNQPNTAQVKSGAANAYQAAAGGFEQGTGATKSSIVGRTVQDVERELILNTLDYCQGNRNHAADILGISIRTLRNKLKEYNDKAKEGAA